MSRYNAYNIALYIKTSQTGHYWEGNFEGATYTEAIATATAAARSEIKAQWPNDKIWKRVKVLRCNKLN